MPTPFVLLASCRDLPSFDTEHQVVIDALAARGVKCEARPWEDIREDCGAQLVLIRSTWDYHLRREEFLRWVSAISRRVRLYNPAPLVEWNSHKGYLRDLAEEGIATAPTEWVSRGSKADLSALLARRGWTDAVVKPAVSAGGHETFRTLAPDAGARFRKLVAQVDVMVQPYLNAVEGIGERSLIHIGGAFSHAVRKEPLLRTAEKPVDVVTAVEASPLERAFAQRVLRTIEHDWIYARVDTARDDAGTLLLMELEVIEPSLFLKHGPGSADRLADAVVARL